jgi:hypothetical protein
MDDRRARRWMTAARVWRTIDDDEIAEVGGRNDVLSIKQCSFR